MAPWQGRLRSLLLGFALSGDGCSGGVPIRGARGAYGVMFWLMWKRLPGS
jgi:hypothetical protein